MEYTKKQAKLVFDFDGVLIDSRQESILNAFNTASGVVSSSLPNIFEKLVNLFEMNRCHVRSAGELVSLASWCIKQGQSHNATLTLEEFQKLHSHWLNLPELEAKFFENRTKLQSMLGKKWFELHSPFEPLWSCVNQIADEVLIITHKNKQAVLDLLGYFQLPINAEQIFSGDGFSDKTANFKAIAKAYPVEQYFFLDDNLRNLLELGKNLDGVMPLCLFYADWGYGSDMNRQIALEKGIGVQSQETMVKFINKNIADKNGRTYYG